MKPPTRGRLLTLKLAGIASVIGMLSAIFRHDTLQLFAWIVLLALLVSVYFWKERGFDTRRRPMGTIGSSKIDKHNPPPMFVLMLPLLVINLISVGAMFVFGGTIFGINLVLVVFGVVVFSIVYYVFVTIYLFTKRLS